ncbi:hypothetical protein NUW58_g8660 [Xylaria curta]|uniref:Uncharacterized protein n=1 Tax=Xylaria curta TaxID=42375 RepID=A0ACC1N5T6_9PEZI|nr:hypothetical protein NUW58_g8660 [Xylaria curta]
MAANNPARTIWNDKTRSDLLQVIFEVAPPNSKQWDAISAKLLAKGYTYNLNAAQQHLQKLKRKDGDAASVPPSPATPKKSGKPTAARAKKGTPSTKDRKRANAVDVDEDEDEEKLNKKLKLELQDPDLSQYQDDESGYQQDGVA